MKRKFSSKRSLLTGSEIVDGRNLDIALQITHVVLQTTRRAKGRCVCVSYLFICVYIKYTSYITDYISNYI